MTCIRCNLRRADPEDDHCQECIIATSAPMEDQSTGVTSGNQAQDGIVALTADQDMGEVSVNRAWQVELCQENLDEAVGEIRKRVMAQVEAGGSLLIELFTQGDPQLPAVQEDTVVQGAPVVDITDRRSLRVPRTRQTPDAPEAGPQHFDISTPLSGQTSESEHAGDVREEESTDGEQRERLSGRFVGTRGNMEIWEF